MRLRITINSEFMQNAISEYGDSAYVILLIKNARCKLVTRVTCLVMVEKVNKYHKRKSNNQIKCDIFTARSIAQPSSDPTITSEQKVRRQIAFKVLILF